MNNSFLEFLNLSTWQSLVTFLFILATIIVVIFLFKLVKKRIHIYFISFFIGFFSGILFSIIFKNSLEGDLNWLNQSTSWLNFITTIFISLFVLIIPLLIFTKIVLGITKQNFNWKISIFYLKRFSFILLSVILILFLIPIITHINLNFVFEPFVDSSGNILNQILFFVPSSLSIFTSIYMFISVVIFAILISFAIKIISKKEQNTFNSIFNFFTIVDDLLFIILKWIMYLIPIIVITQIPILFLYEYINYGSFLIIFSTIFLIILIIFMVDFIVKKILIYFDLKNKQKTNKKESYFDLENEKINGVLKNNFNISLIMIPLFFIIIPYFATFSIYSPSLTPQLIFTNIILILIIGFFPLSEENDQNIIINILILMLVNFQLVSFATTIAIPIVCLIFWSIEPISKSFSKKMNIFDKILIEKINFNRVLEKDLEQSSEELYLLNEQNEYSNQNVEDLEDSKEIMEIELYEEHNLKNNEVNLDDLLLSLDNYNEPIEKDNFEENLEEFSPELIDNIKIEDDDIERNVW